MVVFGSLLSIKTADKPGLLMEIIQIMNDINISVESAEIDTEVQLHLVLFLLSESMHRFN